MAARVKKSDYLVKYAEAQLGRPYWRGTLGQHASPALLAYERKRFPDSYKAADFEAQARAGKKVHDCCGLIKAANMCDTVNADPETGDTETFRKFDLNPKMYFDRARVKGDDMKKFPKVEGYLVYNSNKSHVGVYVGNDTVTEARGHAYGVVHSSINDKRWKFWSDDINIEYPAKEDDEVKYDELEVCRKGSKGDAVRTIQANVHVFVDGVFGTDTEKAVKEFQKKKGLTADGVVGQKTWKAIIEGWEKK